MASNPGLALASSYPSREQALFVGLYREPDQSRDHGGQVDQAHKHFHTGQRTGMGRQGNHIADASARQQCKAQVIELGPASGVRWIGSCGESARLQRLGQDEKVREPQASKVKVAPAANSSSVVAWRSSVM